MMWSRNLDRKIEEAGWLLDKKDSNGIVYKKSIWSRFYIKHKFVEILHNQITVYTLCDGLDKEPARLAYKELRLFEKNSNNLRKNMGGSNGRNFNCS